MHPVVRHQQPAAAALFQRVEVIAGRGLRDLVEEGMRIVTHHSAQGGVLRQRFREQVGFHPQAGTGHLDVDAGRRAVVAEYQRQPHHPFIADGSDFRRLAVAHRVHERTDAALDEIDVFDGLVRAVERLPVGKPDRLQVASQAGVIARRQQREQAVYGGVAELAHSASAQSELRQRYFLACGDFGFQRADSAACAQTLRLCNARSKDNVRYPTFRPSLCIGTQCWRDSLTYHQRRNRRLRDTKGRDFVGPRPDWWSVTDVRRSDPRIESLQTRRDRVRGLCVPTHGSVTSNDPDPFARRRRGRQIDGRCTT